MGAVTWQRGGRGSWADESRGKRGGREGDPETTRGSGHAPGAGLWDAGTQQQAHL